MSDYLKPCPFCGGEAQEAEMPRAMIAWVYCQSCGAASGYRETEEAAIAAWNQRVCTVEESDEELYLDIAQGLFDDLMAADKDKAKLWARAWPDLFGKDEDDGGDLV